MSLVEEALRSQKKIWREIVQTIHQSGMSQNLPPQFPKRIIFFGVGSSLTAARLVAWTLTRAKSQPLTQIVCCSSVDIGTQVIPQLGDWVFALSHRGRTEATLRALENCSRSGAFTVLVAARDVVPEANIRFLLPTSPLEKCEPHTIGLTGAICAVTSLLLGSQTTEQWSNLARQADPDLQKLKTEVGEGPTLLLGEWEGEWIAREISLKLTEMAQLRVPVYSTEEFFHGPQVLSQSLGDAERIWYIPTRGDRRQDQVKSVYKTKELKDSSLGWISALVDLQWRCLAVSLNLGKNPDGLEVR